VQNLVLGAITLIATVLAVIAAVAVLDRRGRMTRLQVALGLGIGLFGAFLVLVSRTDLVPDGPETGLEQLAVIAVTVAVVLGTLYRIARA